MDTAALKTSVWPWLWPSVLLLVWCVGGYLSTRWLFGWLGRHVDRTNHWLQESFVDRVRAVIFLAIVLVGLVFWAWLVPLPNHVDAWLQGNVTRWFWPSLALIVWLAAGLYIAQRNINWFARRALATTTIYDDALAVTLRRPLYMLVVILGVDIWAALVPVPESTADFVAEATRALTVFMVVILIDGLVQGWMTVRSRRSNVLATSGGVLRSAARVVVYLIGILTLLPMVGVDVTPVIASLGIGSLAIGLALQKTLEDFLAGLLLAADQPVRVGDFVELESGEAGVILSIGWRTVRLRTRDEMHVIVPNAKLAQATLVNRSLPTEEVSFTIPVGVHYGSDLNEAADIALATARQVLTKHPEGVAEFEPRVVFQEFAESSINFNVWLRAQSWELHFRLRDRFIRELQIRFADAGIVIPFPIRTLDLPPGSRLEVGRATG